MISFFKTILLRGFLFRLFIRFFLAFLVFTIFVVFSFFLFTRLLVRLIIVTACELVGIILDFDVAFSALDLAHFIFNIFFIIFFIWFFYVLFNFFFH